MNFDKLKLAIEKSGVSITDLTRNIGIDRSTFYNNMEKRTLKVETLERICKAIDKKVWEFFEGYQAPEDKKTLCEKELLKAYKELNHLRKEKESLKDYLIAAEDQIKYLPKRKRQPKKKSNP